MGYSRRPKSKAEFLAEADAVPLESTGFDPKGVEAVIALRGQRKPWEDLDPNARALNVFNLRLNDHDLAILRHLASLNEDISMQKIAKRIIVPELRRRVGLEQS